jgi:hypothetical protein
MRKLILAAAAATLIAAPTIAVPALAAAKTAPAASDAGAPSIRSCSAKWRGFTDAEKDAWKAKAEGKTGRTGRKLSGYNVFTSDCMKH